MDVRLTVVWREDGQRVGKHARIENDRIVTDAKGKAHPDRFDVAVLSEPREQMCSVARKLKPNQCIVAGVPKSGKEAGTIVLKKRRKDGETALSDDDFQWPDGPGMMLLDYDPKSLEEGWRAALTLDVAGFVEAVHSVAPGLLLSSSRWPSSSSCIRGEGIEPRGVRGFHHAVPVLDASDIPRAGWVLFKRLVLHGLGFAFVSKPGFIEVRTIIDAKVWRPACPWFAGGVDLADGLSQADRNEQVTYGPSSDLVDTRKMLVDLTDEEEDAFEAECDRLRESARELAAERRAEWTRSRATAIAERMIQTERLSPDQAQTRANDQVAAELASASISKDGRRYVTLHGGAVIETDSGFVTVDEILDNPHRWHGAPCADPLEPEYGRGVGTATIYTDASPTIHSFAHGDCTYWLKRSARREFAGDDDDDAVLAQEIAPGVVSRDEQTTAASSAGNDEKTAQPEDPNDACTPAAVQDSPHPSGAAGVRNAADLLAKTFEPVRWAVEELLPRGCWILGGKPKTGKSWLALSLLLAVAGGTKFLGRRVDEGDCLYLALEDSDRRMRERIVKLAGASFPRERLARLSYHTDWQRGEEGVKQLRAHLKTHPTTRLIVVDTLARVKPQAAKGSNAYEADYAALAPLQQLASRKGITLIVVTHLRKQISDDPFDDITGSLGAQAAVDGTLHLSRHAGNNKQLLLRARGRDLEGDIEMVLARDEDGQFSDLGDPLGVSLAGDRKRIVEYLEYVGADGASATELHKALGRRDLSGTRKLLDRMADDLAVLKREGRYFTERDDGGDASAAPVKEPQHLPISRSASRAEGRT